jgi:hypothetical protein
VVEGDVGAACGGRETVGAVVEEWARSWDCIVADRLQQPASASSEEMPVLRLCPPCRGRFTASTTNFVACAGQPCYFTEPAIASSTPWRRTCRRRVWQQDSRSAVTQIVHRRVLTAEAVNEYSATGDGSGREAARRMQHPFLSAPAQRSYLFGCYCWEPRPVGDTPQAHLIASIKSTSLSSCKLTYSATGQHATAANTLCAVHR